MGVWGGEGATAPCLLALLGGVGARVGALGARFGGGAKPVPPPLPPFVLNNIFNIKYIEQH